MTRKVLVVSHGHPVECPGGGEVMAYTLHRSLRAAGVDSQFLFVRDAVPAARGSAVAPYAPNEWWLPFSAPAATAYRLFDDLRTFGPAFAQRLRRFLVALKPSVVHFHHYFRIGLDTMVLARAALPNSAICLTLHDLKALCPDNGYMRRRHELRQPAGIRELCTASTLERCRECCDEVPYGVLEQRLQDVHAKLEAVDLFLCPSRFVLDRYAQWGVPRERLRHVPNGRTLPPPRPEPLGRRRRDRFGFFGRAIEVKGLSVLLDAFARLAVTEGTASLTVNADVPQGVGRWDGRLRWCGGYAPEELAERMAGIDWVVVSSIWWENSPVVIQEAFLHGRPVLCGDVGGMAEHVRDGVDGLYFRVGDAADLAATMERACSTPGLWDALVAGSPPVLSAEAHARATLAAYDAALGLVA